MNRGHGGDAQRRPHDFATVLRDPKCGAHQRLSGCSPEKHEQARLYRLDLRLEPRPARPHLLAVRLFVEAALAAPREAEVLDGVGHVDARPFDAGGFESLVEDAAGGSDEGLALDVLAIAWLLADEHQHGATRAVAEDGLSGLFPQIAAPASGSSLAQPRQSLQLRDELFCAHLSDESCAAPAIPTWARSMMQGLADLRQLADLCHVAL